MPKHHAKHGGSAVAEKPPVRRRKAPVAVSYPKDGQTIVEPSYTLQIEVAEPASAVALALGEGEWRACREALGLWWYDWDGYDSGTYQVVARMMRPDGSVELSEPTLIEVRLD